MTLKNLWLVIIATAVLGGCSPEIGSESWCQDMKDKDKGDWTASEATDFAKHCIFK